MEKINGNLCIEKPPVIWLWENKTRNLIVIQKTRGWPQKLIGWVRETSKGFPATVSPWFRFIQAPERANWAHWCL
jgi:hypothetical protein